MADAPYYVSQLPGRPYRFVGRSKVGGNIGYARRIGDHMAEERLEGDLNAEQVYAELVDAFENRGLGWNHLLALSMVVTDMLRQEEEELRILDERGGSAPTASLPVKQAMKP